MGYSMKLSKNTKPNLRILKGSFNFEKIIKAQELCDIGKSNYYIAGQLDVTVYTVEKWIKLGILKLHLDENNRKKKQIISKAEQLIENGGTIRGTAERVGVNPSTILRWKRQGKIKCT